MPKPFGKTIWVKKDPEKTILGKIDRKDFEQIFEKSNSKNRFDILGPSYRDTLVGMPKPHMYPAWLAMILGWPETILKNDFENDLG